MISQSKTLPIPHPSRKAIFNGIYSAQFASFSSLVLVVGWSLASSYITVMPSHFLHMKCSYLTLRFPPLARHDLHAGVRKIDCRTSTSFKRSPTSSLLPLGFPPFHHPFGLFSRPCPKRPCHFNLGIGKHSLSCLFWWQLHSPRR